MNKNLPGWITEMPIAHRGYFNNEAGIPENSLPAFQRAIKHGYSIELDVHLTKDEHVVVYHDNGLKRMNGVKKTLSDIYPSAHFYRRSRWHGE